MQDLIPALLFLLLVGGILLGVAAGEAVHYFALAVGIGVRRRGFAGPGRIGTAAVGLLSLLGSGFLFLLLLALRAGWTGTLAGILVLAGRVPAGVMALTRAAAGLILIRIAALARAGLAAAGAVALALPLAGLALALAGLALPWLLAVGLVGK